MWKENVNKNRIPAGRMDGKNGTTIFRVSGETVAPERFAFTVDQRFHCLMAEPRGFSKMSFLQVLNFSSCHLRTKPDGFARFWDHPLRNLKLRLSGNGPLCCVYSQL
ncbi:MAG: hypothetical protein HUJ26_22080 [Planctomycetaceae bacterium]|nr:hypothetical protein [Planctomycetaceae bacterium]